ncbi:MAG: hypothetical protein ABFD60_07850 [Bryobacteraceae bacterium]
MATNAAQRETIARQIMEKGYAIAIANPRGSSVDAILVKEFDYHVPANATDVKVWYEYTGNNANTAYGLSV